MVQPPMPSQPSLTILEPMSDMLLEPGSNITVSYAVGSIEDLGGVFAFVADVDGDPSTTDDQLPLPTPTPQPGSLGPIDFAWDTTAVPAGSYRILGSLDRNGVVTAEAPGGVRLDARPTVQVDTPVAGAPLDAVSRGGALTIGWTTNDPERVAETMVLADDDGDPTTGMPFSLVNQSFANDGTPQERMVPLRGLLEGTWQVVAVTDDGVHDPVVSSEESRFDIVNVASAGHAQRAGAIRTETFDGLPNGITGLGGSFDASGGDVRFGFGFREVIIQPNLAVTREAFAAVWDEAGKLEWAGRIGVASGASAVTAMVFDPQTGRLFVAGTFVGRIDFGTTSLLASGAQDVDGFVARYSPSGDVELVTQIQSSQPIAITDLALEPVPTGAKLWVAGSFTQRVDVGGFGADGAAVEDVFLVQLDSDGLIAESVRGLGGMGIDTRATLAAAEPNQGVVIAGQFSNSMVIDPGAAMPTTLSSSGGLDVFLMKWSEANSLEWAVNIGSAANETVEDVACLADGSFAAVGVARGGDITFASGLPEAVTLISFGLGDGWSARYEATTGTLRWATWAVSSQGVDHASRLVATPDNGLVVGGFYGPMSRFAGMTQVLPLDGPIDTFFSKMSASGELEFVRRATSAGSESVLGMASREDGSITVAGTWTGGPLILGGGDARETTLNVPAALLMGTFTARMNADLGF